MKPTLDGMEGALGKGGLRASPSVVLPVRAITPSAPTPLVVVHGWIAHVPDSSGADGYRRGWASRRRGQPSGRFRNHRSAIARFIDAPRERTNLIVATDGNIDTKKFAVRVEVGEIGAQVSPMPDRGRIRVLHRA